jgi:hypothetical protein
MQVRNEINTRFQFAKEQGEYWFNKIKSAERGGGNVVSCKASEKYCQARRVYLHYQEEFTKFINTR